ncbi:MAG: DNA primase DnaG [Nitrososphaerota archaeon]|nr:DNA primase DnaG [Candidatus Calditenuaceae archaeon]MDW8072913.1 DNA primase DnaG [Nitrososphaerota archaeon]
MASQAVATKYVIEARIEVEGVVDRNDVIGATFGQTEGIFSSELDLRELQRVGRIGRIDVSLQVQGNKTIGKISIPSGLDRFYTALLAAMIESLDRVGPYVAKVTIERIEDLRAEKRRRIVERARAILYEWERKKIPEDDEILRELEESVVKAKVVEIGPEKIEAGPEALSSDEVIVSEGRADVINLMRHGYRNVIAVGGIKIPQTLQDLLSRKKRVIAFLDGDRGGDMVLREMAQSIKIDYVARAPYGKEVEELNAKEIEDALREAQPLSEALRKAKAETAQVVEALPQDFSEKLSHHVEQIEGTLIAVAFDSDFNELWRKPVSELAQQLSDSREYKYVLFDGVVTQRLIDIASSAGSEVYLIGARLGENLTLKPGVKVMTMEKLRQH